VRAASSGRLTCSSRYPCTGGANRQRRFNQSALLAEVVAKESKRASDKARGLRVSYGAFKRVKNVQGAFGVPADARIEVAGRRLVQVDGVLTSGATIEACTRALLRAGAASVDLLVFARVVAPALVPI
jgi:predicted amidophosphoribosyltransferase